MVNCSDVNKYEMEIIVIGIMESQNWVGLEGDLETHLVTALCCGKYNLLYETVVLFDQNLKIYPL